MKYTKLILDERMIVPEPKVRLEFFLHAIVTGETCELKPKTVDEEYLYAIATSDTSRIREIYPRTLVEIYYDAILNNSVEDLPTPKTRWEEFLRSAVTKEPCELEPETSLEIYLSQISSNGGFDYIVSTSTNSTIISLPNSTNGIIKSIEIDGNTLVNYCKNGSEELTLNNEINVQGTDVTLTDTVDNGKVDVACEGNTLILDEEGNEVEAGTEGARLVSVGELEDNKIEIVSGNSDNTSSSTHSIQLSESLRGLPNGVCDKFVKQGGKWYVERNCREIILNGSEDWAPYTPSDTIVGFYIQVASEHKIDKGILISDKFVGYGKDLNMTTVTTEGIYGDNFFIKLGISKTKLSTQDKVGFKNWLKDNPVKIIYKLQIPTYEPLELCPIVNTYNDATHISNNSTIPCNMQVKNSGYNTIIKPSTTYTIAFDTDKTGTVGVDLGGVKISTTNSVATITTPSTLTDDSLRLYGKGIKASKVRLLEGDKANYIPSYFEGMKSCFEDKEQDNGSYEVEIVSYNENKSNSIQLQLNEPLRAVGDVKDRFVLKDGKLMIERNCGELVLDGSQDCSISGSNGMYPSILRLWFKKTSNLKEYQKILCDKLPIAEGKDYPSIVCTNGLDVHLPLSNDTSLEVAKQWLSENPIKVVYMLAIPTYEEVPTSQKLVCYENATLFIDTNIIPTHVEIEYPTEKQQLFRIK